MLKNFKTMGKILECTLLQRRYSNDQLLHKRHSASLVIREMKIEAAMRFLSAPTKMVLINNQGKQQVLVKL